MYRTVKSTDEPAASSGTAANSHCHGPTDGGSGEDEFPSAGQAASDGDSNMCARPFGELRSTFKGAASSVGGDSDMDQSAIWSNRQPGTPATGGAIHL
ncbi:hypothetical protein EJB05_42591, partial [Eragrostis curvula]